MHTRRQALALVSSAVALGGCTDGSGVDRTPTDVGDTGDDPAATGGQQTTPGGSGFLVSTPAFEDGGTIPRRHTGVGADVSPRITVERVPTDVEALALVVDDPDAPTETPFVHWVLWNVPGDVTTVPEGLPQQETLPSLDGARQGTNGFDELGYRGPLPPAGDGPHTYRFTAMAVETTVDLAAGARRDALESALEGEVLATDRFTGEFER